MSPFPARYGPFLYVVPCAFVPFSAPENQQATQYLPPPPGLENEKDNNNHPLVIAHFAIKATDLFTESDQKKLCLREHNMKISEKLIC